MAILITGPEAMAAAPPPLQQQAEIVETFANSVDDPVVLRRGFWSADAPNSGFGYAKITGKHGITNLGVVRYLLAHPDTVTQQGNGRWAHDVASRRFTCSWSGCVEAERVTVRAVIDYKPWVDGTQFGVVTVYCLNLDKAWACPKWVNTALNV